VDTLFLAAVASLATILTPIVAVLASWLRRRWRLDQYAQADKASGADPDRSTPL
jgi:hypothetical protein